MLNLSQKTKYSKLFLPIVLLAFPLVSNGLSLSSFLNFFKSVTTVEEIKNERQESLQSLKVFEPNKVFADSEIVDAKKINLLDEKAISFEPHQEFTDDLSSDVSENHSENAVYTVQQNDSIYSIASYFGVSVETILTFNHKNSKMVHTGEVLEVPSVSGVLYEVGKGDTLLGISKKYDLDPEDVSLYNGLLSTDDLAAGDEIFLPGAKDTSTAKKTTTVKRSINGISTSKTFVKDVAITKSQHWEKGDTSHLNTPAAIAKNSSLPKYDGYYLFPTPGATRTQKMHGNNGCDLANKLGSSVLAAADGVVIVAKTGGYNFGYGNYIKIKHSNGTETLYGHLSRVDVSVGQAVSRGEQIGAVGSTGNSTGPHLHFEVHGAYNPFAW